jgi:hypothetical protein
MQVIVEKAESDHKLLLKSLGPGEPKPVFDPAKVDVSGVEEGAKYLIAFNFAPCDGVAMVKDGKVPCAPYLNAQGRF